MHRHQITSGVLIARLAPSAYVCGRLLGVAFAIAMRPLIDPLYVFWRQFVLSPAAIGRGCSYQMVATMANFRPANI